VGEDARYAAASASTVRATTDRGAVTTRSDPDCDEAQKLYVGTSTIAAVDEGCFSVWLPGFLGSLAKLSNMFGS
jgi:hypothetical protein